MPLPKVKDPMIVELKSICETKLAIPTKFIEANLKEANFGVDDLKDSDFPVLVFVTSRGSDNDVNEAGEIQRESQLLCLLLNRLDNPTKDYSSSETNDLIYQMYQLAQNLQYWINKSGLSVDGGVNKWKNENLFEQFDAHLFGQQLNFGWKVNTGTTGYYNNPG